MRLEELGHDLVRAFRSLHASPGYSLIVVLTVGLGIAATTTTVSFMSPYLIRELPFEDPARLVQIGQIDGIGPFDLVTVAVVVGVFLGIAILATLLPAIRAAATVPIGVLRYE